MTAVYKPIRISFLLKVNLHLAPNSTHWRYSTLRARDSILSDAGKGSKENNKLRFDQTLVLIQC